MITAADKLLLVSRVRPEVKGAVEFVSSTSMTITPKFTNLGVTLEYSLNGTSWTTIASGAATPSANIIYFRGQATGTKSLYNSTTATNAWTFTGATNLKCNGKLDRLIQDALGSDDDDILTIGSYCFNNMFYNVSTLIKAPTLPAMTLASNCYQSMFYECTGLTVAPTLPAMTLTTLCYQGMFRGCTGLTVAPTLPAMTLAGYCYYGMFQNCTKIKLSTTMTGIYDTAYRIPTVGTGTTAENAFYKMFELTGGTFIGDPEINTTYYTENTPV